ncbi:MAG: hypothetical protein AB1444_02155 [Spirochaetota bacterium]
MNEISVSFHYNSTHVESGIDLRYIQKLLGHKSTKTAEIYTLVSNSVLGKIKNPLDTILNPDVKINEVQAKEGIDDVNVRYNDKMVGYTTVMSYMNTLYAIAG